MTIFFSAERSPKYSGGNTFSVASWTERLLVLFCAIVSELLTFSILCEPNVSENTLDELISFEPSIIWKLQFPKILRAPAG